MSSYTTAAFGSSMGDPYAALQGIVAHDTFTPFSIDVTPLQKLLINLAQSVEKLQEDNSSLRADLANLKVGARLELLEANLQELSDNTKGLTGYPTGPVQGRSSSGQTAQAWPGPGGTSMHGRSLQGPVSRSSRTTMAAAAGGADGDSAALNELTHLKERVDAMERRSEALWHTAEQGEEMRGQMARLQEDVQAAQASVADAQGVAQQAVQLADQLQGNANQALNSLSDVVGRVTRLEEGSRKAADERREAGSKVESHVNSIWDQIRHMESSLSQRLTLAETSQVSTLQELDEQKEAVHEVVVRLDEARRHAAALESKLDSFNTQVAAALSPLHNSLSGMQVRLEDLAARKQDTATALTLDDVNAAAARAVDHTDRRADALLQTLGTLEGRVEALDESKAALDQVVMADQLQSLLQHHAQQLGGVLEAQREELLQALTYKASREDVTALESRQGARLGVLEAAILKGLRTLSDRVAAALAEKLDITHFADFKVQVRAILADVEDRLRDWSPAARGMKATLEPGGLGQGPTSCLCCDSRVRSVRELQSMGFTAKDRVMSPERLPATESMLPSIARAPDAAGAYNNAKVQARKREAAGVLRAGASPPTGMIESTSGGQGLGHNGIGPPLLPSRGLSLGQGNGGLVSVDPSALLSSQGSAAHWQGPGQGCPSSSTPGGVMVGIETVHAARQASSLSGQILSGTLPNTRNPGRGPSKGARPGSERLEPWSSGTPGTASPLLHSSSAHGGVLEHTVPGGSSPQSFGLSVNGRPSSDVQRLVIPAPVDKEDSGHSAQGASTEDEV